MLIDKFIKNAEASNSMTKIVHRTNFVEMKEAIRETYDYIYLPSLEIFNEFIIDEKGINKALLQANYGIAETGTIILYHCRKFTKS